MYVEVQGKLVLFDQDTVSDILDWDLKDHPPT
jgi:hypothetical protein